MYTLSISLNFVSENSSDIEADFREYFDDLGDDSTELEIIETSDQTVRGVAHIGFYGSKEKSIVNQISEILDFWGLNTDATFSLKDSDGWVVLTEEDVDII